MTPTAFFRRFQRVFRRHKVKDLPPLVGKNVAHWLRELSSGRLLQRHRHESQFDQDYGTETERIREVGSLDIDSPNVSHAVRYEPSPDRLTRHVIHSLPIDFKAFSFVDFGAGKGRVLLIAAEFPFREVRGIEFCKELCDVAISNLDRMPEGKRATRTLECKWMDAVDAGIPDGPAVFYLYNPFDAHVMSAVERNIATSLRSRERDAFVIYVHPEHSEVWEGDDIWSRWEKRDVYVIYRYRPFAEGGRSA